MNARIVPPGGTQSLVSMSPREFDKTTSEGRHAAVHGMNANSHMHIIIVPLKLWLSPNESQTLADVWRNNMPSLHRDCVALGNVSKCTLRRDQIAMSASPQLSTSIYPEQHTIQSIGQPSSRPDQLQLSNDQTYRSLSTIASAEFTYISQFDINQDQQDVVYRSLQYIQSEFDVDDNVGFNFTDDHAISDSPSSSDLMTLIPIIEFLDVICTKGRTTFASHDLLPELTVNDGLILRTSASTLNFPPRVSRDAAEPIQVVDLLISKINLELDSDLCIEGAVCKSLQPTLNAIERHTENMGSGFLAEELAAKIAAHSSIRALREEFPPIYTHDAASNDDFISTELVCIICVNNPVQKMPLGCLHVCICATCPYAILNTCPICRGDASVWGSYTMATLQEMLPRVIRPHGFDK